MEIYHCFYIKGRIVRYMIFKRLVSFGAAMILACGCGLCALADDSEEKPIKFKVDKEMTVSEKDKIGYTFSFDNKDWKDYVKLTPDSEKAGLKLDSQTSRAYQGASLKISADNGSEIKDLQNNCWEFTGSDNKSLFPDVSEETEGLITMGIEINAEDVGVTTFDGSMIVFTYRFDEKGVEALLGNSIAAYTAKQGGYIDSGSVLAVKKNDTISNNIEQFRDAVISVPTKGNSTKIVIEIPVQKAYSGEIITIDNIDICLPGDNGYIKNLDGYNENATPKETVEELEITGEGKQADTAQAESADTSKEDGTSVRVIIGVVLAAVVFLAAVVAAVVLRFKGRFL